MGPRQPDSDDDWRVQGRRWGARAGDWAQLMAGLSLPAWTAVADATAIAAGVRVLDVGCGSGEFCALAAGRGARVSGVDAAPAMLALARARAPQADLRAVDMASLPWAAREFDVITFFCSLHLAGDPLGALLEARRVSARGGRVGVCTWGPPEHNDLRRVVGAMRALRPLPPPARPALVGLASGGLDRLLRRARLRPALAGQITVPFLAPDQPTLERALLSIGEGAAALEHADPAVVRRAIAAAARRYRRADGTYRLESRFVYAIGAVDD